MTLSERINADLTAAMKARDAARLEVLRLLKSAVKLAALDKGGAAGVLTDEEAAAVVRRQLKQRRDSIESFEKGGRPELAAKERAEAGVLEEYLPQALAPEALAALIDEALRETGATKKAQFGAVMKALSPKIAGRADMKQVSAAVGQRLEA